VLPEPLKITDTEVTFSVAAYATMLQIYNGYILWADTYAAYNELEPLADMRLELCSERLALKDESVQILTDDREHAYRLYEDAADDIKKAETVGTLKTVFISLGTGVVGVAVGIIVGIVVARN
jgi:hypothetical protein